MKENHNLYHKCLYENIYNRIKRTHDKITCNELNAEDTSISRNSI